MHIVATVALLAFVATAQAQQGMIETEFGFSISTEKTGLNNEKFTLIRNRTFATRDDYFNRPEDKRRQPAYFTPEKANSKVSVVIDVEESTNKRYADLKTYAVDRSRGLYLRMEKTWPEQGKERLKGGWAKTDTDHERTVRLGELEVSLLPTNLFGFWGDKRAVLQKFVAFSFSFSDGKYLARGVIFSEEIAQRQKNRIIKYDNEVFALKGGAILDGEYIEPDAFIEKVLGAIVFIPGYGPSPTALVAP